MCREPYSCVRPPKLLGCQHSFCAICLKLLLCVQDDTWSITCPLCRKATAVPGGLICSLRNQEAVMGLLDRPCPEVRLCPQGLVDRSFPMPGKGEVSSFPYLPPKSEGGLKLGAAQGRREGTRLTLTPATDLLTRSRHKCPFLSLDQTCFSKVLHRSLAAPAPS